MNATAVVTIVSNNYLHFARTLMQSVARHHPEADRYCVIVDRDPSHAERARQLTELAGIHRIVLFGLVMSNLSGWLLFFSDVEALLGSLFLWIKLALVGALLVNGFLMTRTEAALVKSVDSVPLWSRMRTLALVSAVLWLATTLAGVVLREYA